MLVLRRNMEIYRMARTGSDPVPLLLSGGGTQQDFIKSLRFVKF